MDAVDSPEILPVGWIEKIATNNQGEEIKFYYNARTGMKFNTKADLLRYTELGIPSQNTRRQTRAQKEGNIENRLMLMPAETNKSPDWLPQGWIMELNATSSGQKYKTYIDPSTGRKFSSKPSILKYLNSDECNDPTLKTAMITAMSIKYDSKPRAGETSGAKTPPKMEGSQTNGTSIQKLMSSLGEKSFKIVRCEAKGLPPGWIKEIRIGRQGDKIRKDPYFTDPESKYVFRSLPDALRYLENKSIKACVMEPRRRETLKFLSNDLSILEETQSLDNTPEISLKTEGPQTQKGTSGTSIQKLMSSSRPKSFEIVRSEAKDLPPGWIKEIKIEKTGDKIRKDPFYTDPESKYVFRSSRDALRYLETKNLKACVIKPRKREELKFLSDDSSIQEEKQSLDDRTEECDGREANHVPISDQPSRTPVSKRKRGKPIASPSIDNFIQHEKPGEAMVDFTNYEGEKVVNEESVDRDSGVQTEERGEKSNLEPQPFERLGGDSSLDPCLEFAYSTLRGDVPAEDSNLPAQSYNQHHRATFNLGFASFSDYARR